MRSHIRVMVMAVALLGCATASAQDKSADAQVKGDKQNLSHVCGEAASVTFTGSDNIIDVHGPCSAVVVNGARNKVVIDVTESLQVVGDDNTVAWDASHIGSSEPKALIGGLRNSVKRQE